MKLYATPMSPYAMRNILQCRIKDLPVAIEAPPGGMQFNQSPEYLAINPLGKIPALVSDEGTLPESTVIALYLEDRFGEIPLLPDGAWHRARVHLLMRLADTYVMDAMIPVFSHLDPQSRDDAQVDAVLANVDKGLGYLEHFLESGEFAVGDSLSLADCALVPILKYCDFFYPFFGKESPLGKGGKVAAYWAKIQAQEVIARGVADMDSALSEALSGGN